MITAETRREAHAMVDKPKRYEQVETALWRLGAATAKEVAVYMYAHGQAATSERNVAHPRLNELVTKGRVEVCSKKPCRYSGKNVAVYRLVRE